ncbi:MAG: rRNA (cytidine-2'-O-)-methyltransferase [Elusimicrobia bacterium HGW-Elusimicrobia-2]|nr:MAG: rRNA (cytidine-2'-O-)-methyltransferase [Elusimicrobia bacterium HGW-Elusimicrobia-2]
MNELNVIATPIGNLADITVRASELLKRSDAIICESSEKTKKLLFALGIKGKPLINYPSDNEGRVSSVFRAAEVRDMCVLVSSAGTPGVSDPGHLIVREARRRGIPVFPVPGPHAPGACLSVCPFKIKEYIFAGFLPRGFSAAAAVLKKYFTLGVPVVAFATKRNIERVSRILKEYFPRTSVFAGREMTKKFEEYALFDDADSFSAWASSKKLGEFTLVLNPRGGLEAGEEIK